MTTSDFRDVSKWFADRGAVLFAVDETRTVDGAWLARLLEGLAERHETVHRTVQPELVKFFEGREAEEIVAPRFSAGSLANALRHQPTRRVAARRGGRALPARGRR